MTSRQPSLPSSLAIALLERLGTCREKLKETAEQLRQLPDDRDASRIAQETVDFLAHWIKSFQVIAGRRF
jgi:hypothetical protein